MYILVDIKWNSRKSKFIYKQRRLLKFLNFMLAYVVFGRESAKILWGGGQYCPLPGLQGLITISVHLYCGSTAWYRVKIIMMKIAVIQTFILFLGAGAFLHECKSFTLAVSNIILREIMCPSGSIWHKIDIIQFFFWKKVWRFLRHSNFLSFYIARDKDL